MSDYRVVMPRALPFAESNRVQREAWRRGYSTRLAGRDTARPTYQVVEFLRLLDELPAPDEVGRYAADLDAFLVRRDADAQLADGHDRLWVETITQRVPHHA